MNRRRAGSSRGLAKIALFERVDRLVRLQDLLLCATFLLNGRAIRRRTAARKRVKDSRITGGFSAATCARVRPRRPRSRTGPSRIVRRPTRTCAYAPTFSRGLGTRHATGPARCIPPRGQRSRWSLRQAAPRSIIDGAPRRLERLGQPGLGSLPSEAVRVHAVAPCFVGGAEGYEQQQSRARG